MTDCNICIHYEACCVWTSKQALAAANEAVKEDGCLECKHFKKQTIGIWIEHVEKPAWLEDDVDVYYECSCCGIKNFGETNYCPCCGARMMEE